MQRENNQTYNTAICNNVFTTLIFFCTLKTKVFSKLNTLDLSLVPVIVTVKVNKKVVHVSFQAGHRPARKLVESKISVHLRLKLNKRNL